MRPDEYDYPPTLGGAVDEAKDAWGVLVDVLLTSTWIGRNIARITNRTPRNRHDT